MPDLRFADGVLFFPVTAFDAEDRLDLGALEQHIARGVEAGPGAVFAACGTGEYHALALEEYELAVRTAVTTTAGRVPVVAGVGGPLGHARSCARLAADAGAEALLVMPPYLVQGPQAGLVAYVDAIIAASDLPVIVYHRGNARFTTDSVVQLLQARREQDPTSRLRLPASVPSAGVLENAAYRVVIVGFIFWTFTLIAGAIWAEAAWGRYWGWDTKEVWTFIIWVVYAGYIHARATRGWRGSRSAWLAIVGYSAVLFNFGIVNVFFKGLHAYSGL